jgi:hypothetical protein
VKNLIILSFILLSCSDKKKEVVIIPKYPNPEHVSMKGKASILFSKDSLLFGDSLLFDAEGRLIKSIDNSLRRYLFIRTYNTKNYPIRSYDSHSAINYKYLYEKKGDTLFQKVYYSELRDYIENDSTFNYEKPYLLNHYLIENGLISHYFESSGSKAFFYYDQNRRLIKQVISNTNSTIIISYDYQGSSLNLKSYVVVSDSDTVHVSKYKEGILYSTSELYDNQLYSRFYRPISKK